VSVITSIKGTRSGETLVTQLGFVADDGATYAAEEQKLLEAGRRYLLVTNREDGQNTLVAGPASSVAVSTPASEARVIREYQQAEVSQGTP
jgi:hypothetical protein